MLATSNNREWILPRAGAKVLQPQYSCRARAGEFGKRPHTRVGYARVRALSKLPCARDNCIGVGALSRHRRWRGLGAFVCDGIARETVEGRGAVSGSLAGMFPARRRSVGPPF